MNLTILKEFIKEQKDSRMVNKAVNGLPANTYVCWDSFTSLNPFGFCQWRGLFRQGSNTYFWFEDEVDTLQEEVNEGEIVDNEIDLHGLKWDNDLALAAAHYLKDLEGCRSLPD